MSFVSAAAVADRNGNYLHTDLPVGEDDFDRDVVFGQLLRPLHKGCDHFCLSRTGQESVIFAWHYHCKKIIAEFTET